MKALREEFVALSSELGSTKRHLEESEKNYRVSTTNVYYTVEKPMLPNLLEKRVHMCLVHSLVERFKLRQLLVILGS